MVLLVTKSEHVLFVGSNQLSNFSFSKGQLRLPFFFASLIYFYRAKFFNLSPNKLVDPADSLPCRDY
jgi:hypothetical protein